MTTDTSKTILPAAAGFQLLLFRSSDFVERHNILAFVIEDGKVVDFVTIENAYHQTEDAEHVGVKWPDGSVSHPFGISDYTFASEADFLKHCKEQDEELEDA